MSPAAHEPGPLAPGTSALTIRPLRLPLEFDKIIRVLRGIKRIRFDSFHGVYQEVLSFTLSDSIWFQTN